MKLALLSDVHSNLHALEAVLEDVEAVSPDAVGFLGDAVGYNAFPDECVQLLRKSCTFAILGNHDEAVLRGGEEFFNDAARAGVEHSRAMLSDQSRAYLGELPVQKAHGSVHTVHGSPRSPTTEYVFPEIPDEVLEEIVRHPSVEGAKMIAMGHTHVPFVRHVGELVVVNVGSVGQPRDRDARACWVLVDVADLNVQLRRVEYDIAAAADAVLSVGLPEFLASRLYSGM